MHLVIPVTGTAAPPQPSAKRLPREGILPPDETDARRDAALTRRARGGAARRRGHWPALDGLRAIAVLAVIGIHVGVLRGGYLGVDVFFVLSGFLITSLLIGEWDHRGGRISFRDFYTRRALRLFPALGCVLVAAAVLAVLLEASGGPGDRPYALSTLGAIPWVVAFAGNLAEILHPGPVALGALGHTWSLAVEEQFYLLWPTLFALLLRRRPSRSRLALWLTAIASAEMVYRVVLAHIGYSHDRIYYGTDTHADGLLIGCAIALWLASEESSRLHRLASRLAKNAAWLGAAILVVLFAFGTQASAPVDISAAVLATGVIVIGVVLGRMPVALERVLCSRQAVLIGRRSYGLYLWHVVIFAAAEALVAPFTGIFPASHGERRIVFAAVLGASVAVSFIVAELSYRLVELPALRIKRRFRCEAAGQ